MKYWNQRWIKVAVVSFLALGCVATVADAHFFRFWWRRPPADPIQDVDFTTGEAAGSLKTFVVTDGELTSRERASLDGTFTASVSGELLTIDEITVSSTSSEDGFTTTTVVVINLDADAPLYRNFFNSQFFIHGTATVTTTVVEDATTTEVSSATSDIDVLALGQIHEHEADGVYHLRGSVRGYDFDDDGAGVLTYSFLNVRLNDSADVVTPST